MSLNVKKVYGALIGAGVALFALAWVPNDSSLGWLATIGFLGSMLALLALVVFTIALAVRRLSRRTND